MIPAVGGMASTATIPMPTGGTWGPTTVKGLATGQYSVQTQIIFKQAGQYTIQTVYSPFAVVNVP